MANVITTLLKMDSTQLRTGLKGAQQSIRETDGVINKAKAGWASAFAGFASSPVAIGAATAAVGAFAASSVKAASDLDESINAVNVTFGESADKILEFGDNAARSVGLAKAEFNQLATPLGAILKNAGTPLDEVADKTIVLTQRAADMASVFNTDVSEALTAIQAGLRGEQDPLERFGVSLSAAKVEARALADTGKTVAKSLTDQEKQLARVEIILDQTNQTAGDFANTSGDIANQTRILKADLENLKAKAGEVLIPALSDLADALIAVGDAAEIADDKINGIVPGGGGFFDTLLSTPTDIAGEFKKRLRDLEEGLGFDVPVEVGPLREKFEQMIADSNAAKDAIQGNGDAAKDAIQGIGDAANTTADEVVDLGDKSANTGAKIGDLAGAFADAEQHLADLNQQAQDNALGALAAAAQGVGDALDAAFGDLEGDLGALDLLDNITEQFGKIDEAAQKATDPQGLRDYNREVRKVQGQLLDYLQTVKDIPPDKVTEIIAQIRTGDIDTLKTTLDDLTKDRFINIGIRTPPTAGFSSLQGLFSPTQATPIIQGATSPPPGTVGGFVDARTITNVFPIGSTPTTQYIDSQTDLRRNGIR